MIFNQQEKLDTNMKPPKMVSQTIIDISTSDSVPPTVMVAFLVPLSIGRYATNENNIF